MKTMLVALLLFTASFAFANPNNPPDRPQRMQLMEDLKLTDAQKDQFEKISYETEKKQIELRSKLESAQLDVRRLMDADNPDKTAIEKKFNDIASAQTAMKMNHFNGWFEKNKVLTPEQQKIWKKAMHQRMKMSHRAMREVKNERMPMMERRQIHRIDRD
ncbi:MAG: periplasmic heavy metal sensor [Ignavibacteriales bacterium]|nr:periplasmic heavy metal sensor [Ignavibacteriales bacterium]